MERLRVKHNVHREDGAEELDERPTDIVAPVQRRERPGKPYIKALKTELG
jgi:hypothetical protein